MEPKTKNVVMPLFGYYYLGNTPSEFEFVFGDDKNGKCVLREFSADNEIPKIDLFSEKSIQEMKDAQLALVVENTVEKYEEKVILLLLAFKIYRFEVYGSAPLYIKYRLCKEDKFLCSIIYETMESNSANLSRKITRADKSELDVLNTINNGFLKLLEMHPVSNRTRNALYFLCRGFFTTRWMDSFIFLTCALESLFSKEGGGAATKTICSRVSKLLCEKDECKYENVERLYNIRSEIVHGRIGEEHKEENLINLSKLEYVITECMKKILDEKIYLIYENTTEKENYYNNLLNP